MRNIYFVIPWLLFTATAAFAQVQIYGAAAVDPDVSTPYTLIDPNLDNSAPVNWTISSDAVILSHAMVNCTIKANRQFPTTCGIDLTANYSIIDANNNSVPASLTLTIERYAFMTGPQTVNAGQQYSYLVCDPCNNSFASTYSWSSTIGEANSSAVISWHLNPASILWPAALPTSALAAGIIGHVRCTVSSSGGSSSTADYPVKVTLPGQGAIIGQHSTPHYSNAPLTYTTAPLLGTPTNCTYQWVPPPGWSGSSTTNTITVTPNGTSAGIISVREYMSSVLVAPASTLTITLGPAPDIKKQAEKVQPNHS